MINQHLQAAIPSLRDATRTVSFSTRRFANANAELQEFIDYRPDAREVRKALPVKLVYQGYKYEEIQTILDVSPGSITSWKQAYEEGGISGLRLNYKGKKSYLTAQQREEVWFFGYFYGELIEKCQFNKLRNRKLLKLRKPYPSLLINLSLLLIPSTVPLVVLPSK